MPPIPLSEKDGALRFEVHAKPRAKKSAVTGARGDAVEIAINAQPVDGAANEELVRFLSKLLGIPRRNVEILRGESAQTKLISVTGIDRDTLLACLTPAPKMGPHTR